MKSYELTYIISSNLSSEEATKEVSSLEAIIQQKGGVITSSHRSEAKPLAYPIKKFHSGYFVVSVFQLEETHLKELQAVLNKHSQIIRFAILIKKPFKEPKKRRTRKTTPHTETPDTSFLKHPEKATPRIDSEKINKKLEEILGE